MSESILSISKMEIQDEIEHRQKLLQTYRKNLRYLEEQGAKYGINVPISVAFEVDQIKKNISELETDIQNLQKAQSEGYKSSPDSSQKNTELLFVPEWSVLKSRVQYVDANLAYKFADASSDTNILFGFTTLFLGALISFLVSASLAKDEISKTIFWTSTAFSFFATLIFAILARRADNRAKDVKKLLFPEPLETERNNNVSVDKTAG